MSRLIALLMMMIVGPAAFAANADLTCGASPRELSCSTKDGQTLVLDTQINRDDFAEDFDGFGTRHDCTYNQFVVNGQNLGPEALVNSKYTNNNQHPFHVMYYGQRVTGLARTSWAIPLSEEDTQRTGGVLEVKFFQFANGTTLAYFVKTKATGGLRYVPVRLVCP